MNKLKNIPIFTDTYNGVAEFKPLDNSVYVFGFTDEARSQHIAEWKSSTTNVSFIEISEQTMSSFIINGDKSNEIFLRSDKNIASLWQGIQKSTNIYIDITGLSHSTWASILKSAIDNGFKVLVVYVEPSLYSRSSAPLEGQIYDLSDKITEISPLPGFAVLAPKKAETLFIPLLGFEGSRLKYIIEQTQPANEHIFPIIGLPGFKPWYVFETLKGNKASLSETHSWQSIRYAPGDCPFSCYYLLTDLYSRFKDQHIKIAPIGTKPHALAAVMFVLNHPQIEIIYDHPVRKPGRTDGSSKLHVYHVSSIVKPNPTRTQDFIRSLRTRRASLT
jgi:hypothetical protein